MRRLIPDPDETSVERQLEGYRPWEEPPAERPFVAMNFAATLDGRATIDGRSGPIGSDTDTAMLVGLRTRFDAVMIGAGTMRAERYGRVVSDPAKRERREALGLPPDPLMVIVSGRLDLPWEAPLFTEGGPVLILTSVGGRATGGRGPARGPALREPGQPRRGAAPAARRARRPGAALRGRPPPALAALGRSAWSTSSSSPWRRS